MPFTTRRAGDRRLFFHLRHFRASQGARVMRQLLVLFPVAVLAGCAGEAPAPGTSVSVASAAPAASAASAPRQICEREPIPGSYRMQTVCYDSTASRDSTAVDDAKDSLTRQSGQTTQMLGRAGAGH
jgi:hypothetical protein